MQRPLRLRFLKGDRASLEGLAAFEGVGSPFQGAAFVAAWAVTRGRALGRESALLVGEDDEGPALLLPLEVVRRGPLLIATFPGETHANANGLLLRRHHAAAGALPAAAIAAAASADGLRIDALDLRRVPDPSKFGTGTFVVPAAEERFAISLDGGLDAVLERGNAKRKRKKFRAQQRHFKDRGGYVFRDLPREERAWALAVFLQQKQERFRELRMPNPFSDEAIDSFLAALFQSAGDDTRLYAVESAGRYKAMIGGIVSNGTFWGMFSSFADDEDAVASPGELLLWHLVERLCAEGLESIDLGPGDERYKRSWCDRVIPQFDVLAALSPRGRAYVALGRASRRLTSAVKGDARLRAAAQRARRLLRRD